MTQDIYIDDSKIQELIEKSKSKNTENLIEVMLYIAETNEAIDLVRKLTHALRYVMDSDLHIELIQESEKFLDSIDKKISAMSTHPTLTDK